MAQRPIVVAASVIVSGLIGSAASAQPSSTDLKRPTLKAVGTCPARVGLAGDGAAVAKVGAELTALGVEVGGPVAGCRSIGARVEMDGNGGIAVAIVDGARRSEGRVVADAAVAAAWIDTWLRDDLDGAGWLVAVPQARAVPPPRRVASVGPPGLEPPVRTDTGVRSGAALIDRIAISAAYEQSWTDDGVSTSGVTVVACLRIGDACVGLRGRHAAEPTRTLEFTAMKRSDTEVLAIATTSFGVGRMTIAPEVGAGVGWRHTARVDCTPATPPSPPPGCMDPTDPNCDPTGMIPPDGGGGGTGAMPTFCDDTTMPTSKVYVGDNLSVRTYTPRLAASVRLAVPLFDHVWLEGTASASFAPFGHSGIFGTSSNGSMMTDPTTGLLPEQIALPGEPAASFRIAIGLRVGAR